MKSVAVVITVALGAALAVRGWRHRSEGILHVIPALLALRLGARCARLILPLAWRIRIVATMAERELPGQITIGLELLRDLAHDDPVAYHQFLWANHLAYARSYGEQRLVSDSMEEDRRVMFDLLAAELRSQGTDPTTEVSSMLDLGCSSGFLLRAAETTEFPAAAELVGIDIDRHAIEIGRAHLREAGSRIQLIEGRMEELESLVDGRRFDVTTCCGALLYLDEDRAAETVAALMRSSNRLVGLMSLAHPDMDNRHLLKSGRRWADETWIHNVDKMSEAAGGRVVSRRWQPPPHGNARGLYIVIAAPPGQPST